MAKNVVAAIVDPEDRQWLRRHAFDKDTTVSKALAEILKEKRNQAEAEEASRRQKAS